MPHLSHSQLEELFTDTLTELGLTENERKLYELSLARGPLPIVKIAESLGIPRPNVYKVITGLERQGLAHTEARGKTRKTFMVEPPTTVTELLRKKRARVQAYDDRITHSMPDLLALYHQGELPTSIRIFHGADEFRKTHEIIVEEMHGTIQFFGSAKDIVTFNTWIGQHEWALKRVNKGVSVQALLLPSEEAEAFHRLDAVERRETRFLTRTPPFVTSFQIFGKKIILWQPKAPLAVLIEDEYIVAMLHAMFDALWEKAKTD